MMRRIDRSIAASLDAVSLVSLCLLLLTVAWVVVTRTFNLRSAGWTDELIELFFAWLLFPCIASLWRSKAHFTVDLLHTMAGPSARHALNIVVELLCLVFLAVFFWQACVFVESSVAETSPVFGLSRLYWYGVMPLMGAVMLGYSIARLVGLVRRTTPDPPN